MGGIFDMNDLLLKNGNIGLFLKEWALLVMTSLWSIAALIGIIHWNRVTRGVPRFNVLIMLCVIIKYFLVWIGCFAGGTIK